MTPLQVSYPLSQLGHIGVEGIEGTGERDDVLLVGVEQGLQQQSKAPAIQEVAVRCLGLEKGVAGVGNIQVSPQSRQHSQASF